MILIHITLLLMFLFSPAGSQEHTPFRPLRFQHISIEEGLSQSDVQAIHQDTNGFIWLGTRDGLNKYDGYTFTHYYPDMGENLGVAGKVICWIEEAEPNILWIATNNGLTRFNTVEESSVSFSHDQGSEETLSSNHCNMVFQDSKKRLWVATDRGVNRFQPESQTFERYYTQTETPFFVPITKILEVNGVIWAVDSSGNLARYNEKTNKFDAFSHPALSKLHLTTALETDKVIFFGGYENRVVIFNKLTGDSQQIDLDGRSQSMITGFTIDWIGRIWVATLDGSIYIFDRSAERFEIIGSPNRSIHPAMDVSINAIDIDRSGVIWLATRGYGLYSYSPFRNKFQLINNTDFANQRINGAYIYALLRDKNDLWISSVDKGLERLNLVTGEHHFFKLPTDDFDITFTYSTFLHTSEGSIWYFPRTNHAMLLDNESNTARILELEDIVVSAVELESGEIITGGRQNILKIFASDSDLLINKPSGTKKIPLSYIEYICEIEPDILWLGTGDGLVVWNRISNQMRIHQNQSGSRLTLPDNHVRKILPLKNGSVAVATQGGLAIYDKKENLVDVYTIADGLANDSIYSMEEDNQGFLWLSTNKGLIQLDSSRGVIQQFGLGDGLQSNEFNTKASYKFEDGTLYFGGINGINAFNPQSLTTNNYQPKTQFTSILLMGKELLYSKALREKHIIETSYARNYFNFRFAVMDYNNPAQNRFKYRIAGIDDSFTFLDTERSLNVELPPGHYDLEVFGANSDGTWGNEPAVAKIVVIPPFWSTLEFIGFISFMLVIIIVCSYLMYSRNINVQQQRLEMEVASKTRELETSNNELEAFNYMISHDLRSPLMNVSHYVQILRENLGSRAEPHSLRALEKIGTSVLSMRRLIRDLLYFSRSSSIDYRIENLDLYMICLECISELREKYDDSRIVFEGSRNVPVSADAELLKIALKNILTNSVKYAPDPGNIHIRLSATDGTPTVFRIVDNGITIDPEDSDKYLKPFIRGANTATTSGTGIGLAIVNRIISRHGGSVWLEATPGGGTTVAFTLIQKENTV